MAKAIKLPRMTDTMEEGVVDHGWSKWGMKLTQAIWWQRLKQIKPLWS